MPERLAAAIAADLRGRDNPLLEEAADKLDGLIEDLARAENARDDAIKALTGTTGVLAKIEQLVDTALGDDRVGGGDPWHLPADVELLARQRDEARAEVATALAGWDKAQTLADIAQADRLALTRECDSLARRCSVRFEETQKLHAQLGEAQRAVHHRLGHRGDVEAYHRAWVKYRANRPPGLLESLWNLIRPWRKP